MSPSLKPKAPSLPSLPDEILRSIVSYLLAYSTVVPSTAADHGSLVLSCKCLHAAVARNLCTYIHTAMCGLWSAPPRNWMNAVYTDAIRLGIHGVSRRMSLLLGAPASVLDELEYEEQQITRWINVHVFSLDDVIHVLSELYPIYQTPSDARSRAIKKRRGWYAAEQARKRRCLQLDQRRQAKVEERRAKLEAHPQWPLVKQVYAQTRRHDIFGDFFDWKMSCTTKVADVVHCAQTTARLLEVLHPDDLPPDLTKDQDTMAIVRRHVCSTFQNAVNTVIKRSKQCRSHLCIGLAARECVNHMCGVHCVGPECKRHRRFTRSI